MARYEMDPNSREIGVDQSDTHFELRMVEGADEPYFRSVRFLDDRRYWIERFAHERDLVEDTAINANAVCLSGQANVSRHVEKLGILQSPNRSGHALIALAVLYCFRRFKQSDIVVLINPGHKRSSRQATFPEQPVPLRLRVDANSSFNGTLDSVRFELSRAMRHRRYGWNLICRDADVAEVMKGKIAVVVDFFGSPEDESPSFATLKNSIMPTLSIWPKEEYSVRWSCFGVKDAIVFRQEEALDLASRILDSPTKGIGSFAVLSARESNLLDAFNVTDHPLLCSDIPSAFEEAAKVSPHLAAVTTGTRSLTYRELNERADILARNLMRCGIVPEDVVAIAAKRSVELVVGLLGILKCGAAFLTLDLASPLERLNLILLKSQPVLILVDPQGEEILGDSQNVMTLCFDELGPQVNVNTELEQATLKRRPTIRPSSIAYLNFTSGSTGEPKAVIVTHEAMLNLLRSLGLTLRLGSETTLLSNTSPAFDIVHLEIFGPLVHGGTVWLASDEVIDRGSSAFKLLESGNITHFQSVPSTLQSLIGSGLRLKNMMIMCGGDVLPLSLAEALLEGKNELWNLYGPTETTIWSTAGRVNSGQTVSIGRPLANTKVFILDELLHKVPIGISSDLYIAGMGLARGYYRQFGLTAERFVANPHGPPGSRMYRTGDIARWRADGTIEFIGRSDHQIKIRGFRVEPVEVEVAIRSHKSVSQALVVARDDHIGGRQLIGYAVATVGESVNSSELRRHLANRLPEYMVPAAIVSLERFPLTPNGKLDRRALPAPEFMSTSTRQPRNPQEQALATVFAEVLGVKHVGIDDDFFELGGHSLLATKLISKIRSIVGLEVEIKSLFGAPTVAELALLAPTGRKTTRPPLRPMRGL